MSSRKRRGLGQGLGALIPASSALEEDSREGNDRGLREIPINSILPNPFQPRSQMEEKKLQELTDSIQEHGIIQPLIVTQIEDGAVGERFRLIAGERRWRAARRVGLSHVPVVVKEASEREMLELAIVENIQRADLNPIEEATAFQQMADFSNLTQHQIADRVGKSRSAVANTMRLLQLPAPVQDLVRAGELTEGHARQLLRLVTNDVPASKIMESAELFIRREFNVRQAEAWIGRQISPPPREAPENTLTVHDRELQRQFTTVFGTRVELRRRQQGGQLVIFFENDEDLQSIYSAIFTE